jgi:hypothetical protein
MTAGLAGTTPASGKSEQGIPARVAALVAVLVVLLGGVGIYLYYLRLTARTLEDRPLDVDAFPPPSAEALHRIEDRLAAARAAGGTASLDEAEWNALLFAEIAARPDPRIRLHLIGPARVRLRMSQRDPDTGRYANADLVGAMGLTPAGWIGFAFRDGRVGSLPLGGTSGQWARARIEKQLVEELAANPRLTRWFAGLADVKVDVGRVELRFAGR